GDGNAFRAHLRAALRDVAVPDPVRVLQIARASVLVERVHLECRRVDHVARSHELLEHVMVSQHMADILTEETLDALAEFLHALRIDLVHSPGAIGLRWSRTEFPDRLFGPKVPGHVGHEIAN